MTSNSENNSSQTHSPKPQEEEPIPLPSRSRVSKSAASNGEPKVTSKAAEEHASRKREREGSLEPSAHASTSVPGTPDALPLKKNRLQSDLIREDAAEGEVKDGVEGKKSEQAETETVRKKVQDLTWKEQQETAAAPVEAEAKAETETKDTEEDKAADQSGAKDSKTPPPVRTQPTFSSFSAKASPFSSVPTSSGSSSSSATKGGFGFAASSSPFKSVGGDSDKGWLSKPSGGGIKPSSLGSAIGGKHEEPPTRNSASPAPSKPAIKGPNLGFGAFAGASPLAKAKTGSASPSSASTPSKDGAVSSPAAPASEGEPAGDSFSDKLLSKPALSDATSKETQPLLDAAEADVVTGEEDEQSVYNVRAKLYTMAEDQSWKERGVGTIRINVPKEGKKSARLVMRADGVLRVILNVSLFAGMKCELAEKFVRIVAFEDGSPVHFAIKLSNPTNATAFYDAVQARIAKLA